MISISVNISDGLSPVLQRVLSCLNGEEALYLSEQGGRAAVDSAIEYHREFDRNGGWKGPRYLGPGPDGAGAFGAAVARGWSLIAFDRDGATIANNADHYAFKVSGGTIVPIRAKALTIPLVQEAKGLYASVYQQNTGKKLFVSKSGKALMESTGKGTVRAVYALVKSITMKPWPGAVPGSDQIGSAFAHRYRTSLANIIEKS